MNIQWYPGHMTKTRRMMEESVRLVDAVCEVVDARIPQSSRNPDIDVLTKNKPRLIILNRADQADPAMTERWKRYFEKLGTPTIETDSCTGRGTQEFPRKIRELLAGKIARREATGQAGRPIRVMVVGVPNVGKSAFINRMSGRRAVKAEDRPGVTRGKQWARVDKGLDMLDTPGILWPKFDDPVVGMRLAWTGAVRDDVTDVEELASELMAMLSREYPNSLIERYGVEARPGEMGWELLARAARKRGFLVKGGEPDNLRMAKILLDEFRGGKLGRITLETPPDPGS